MNKQNFTLKDSFPLSTQSLAFMQEMIESVQQLSAIGCTGNYILSGCEEKGGMVSDGFIVIATEKEGKIEREVLPFMESAWAETIAVLEEFEAVTAEGEDYAEARVLRYAVCRTGTGGSYMDWESFTRIHTNMELGAKAEALQTATETLTEKITSLDEELELKANKTDVSNEILGMAVPVGTIVMWASIVPPDGYKLCDGDPLPIAEYRELYAVLGPKFNTTDRPGYFNLPDLRGKFIAGYNKPEDLDFNIDTKKSRGAMTAKLTKKQQGELNVTITRGAMQSATSNTMYSPFVGMTINGADFPLLELTKGGTTKDAAPTTVHLEDAKESFSILPPYYVLAYIIKAKA
jgi:microcystin-dependent protein